MSKYKFLISIKYHFYITFYLATVIEDKSDYMQLLLVCIF